MPAHQSFLMFLAGIGLLAVLLKITDIVISRRIKRRSERQRPRVDVMKVILGKSDAVKAAEAKTQKLDRLIDSHRISPRPRLSKHSEMDFTGRESK